MLAIAAAGAAGRHYYVNHVQIKQTSSTNDNNTGGDENSEEQLALELEALINPSVAEASAASAASAPTHGAVNTAADGVTTTGPSTNVTAPISLAWVASVPARARDAALDSAAWASDSIRGVVSHLLEDDGDVNGQSQRQNNEAKAPSAVERRRLEKLKSAAQV
jgi:hypothetical protein